MTPAVQRGKVRWRKSVRTRVALPGCLILLGGMEDHAQSQCATRIVGILFRLSQGLFYSLAHILLKLARIHVRQRRHRTTCAASRNGENPSCGQKENSVMSLTL